jgi:hypothetical protein
MPLEIPGWSAVEMTAFDKAWNLSKIDYRLDDDDGSKKYLGYSSPFLEEYKYRVPIGYDSEGNLKYSPRDKVVTDNSFIQLPNYGRSGSRSTQDEIMRTIMHEAMHDADYDIGAPALSTSRSRDPDFLGSQERSFDGFGNTKGRNRPTTRDGNFAAETMANIGEYPDRPDIANIAIMNHGNVKPSDVEFMYDKLPAEPVFSNFRDALRSRNRKRHTKGLKRAVRPGITRDPETGEINNEFEEDFVVPRNEQIRRNLVNALRDMAMTRMMESGEFMEDPLTNRSQYDMRGDRPDPRKIKAAERETSKARNAINRFFRKVESGDESAPRSMEDLPEKIQQMIGQQQIRQLVGEQRGSSSEAIVNRNSEFEDMQDKLTYEFESLPLEERRKLLSEYLGFIGQKMRPVKYDVYGNPKNDHENVDTYGHVQSALRDKDEDGNLIYQDVIDEHMTGTVEEILDDYVASYRGGPPGKRARIVPKQRDETLRELLRYYGGDE